MNNELKVACFNIILNIAYFTKIIKLDPFFLILETAFILKNGVNSALLQINYLI